MKKVALIVAGGRGIRMQSKEIKQFLKIGDYPLLMYSICAFYNYDANMEIILILPENEIRNWKKLCNEYNFTIDHRIIKGGEFRFHSVKNGISLVDDHSLVAIHDGVRPLIDKDTIARCIMTAEEKGNAVPVIPLKDSIRRLDNGNSIPEDRLKFVLIQTPQVFYSDILKKAYTQDYHPDFTDDACVVEKMGYKIELINGNEENIKITTPNDLITADHFIRKRKISLCI